MIEKANSKFKEFLGNLMDKTTNGCVETSLQFIRSLKTMIELYRDEIESERKDLHSQNSYFIQWEDYLNGIRKKGIRALFGSKVDENQVDVLSQKLSSYIINLREEKRRICVIHFFDCLERTVTDYERQLNNLHSHLTKIHDKYSDELLRQQQLASSTSKFQLFLHQSDVYKVSRYGLDDSVKADFHTHFSNNGGLLQWLSLSKKQVDSQIWNFAKGTKPVINAVNVSIDEVLKAMNPDDVKNYLEQLKVLASPLWSYNTQGYNQTQLALDKFVIVGVGNCDTSILATDSEYNTVFNTNGRYAYFVNNNLPNKITVNIQEGGLPVFSIGKVMDYHNEASLSAFPTFVDKELNNRIITENFNVMPTIE